MFFRQYQLACLSLFSYLVGDDTTGRAVVVDPQRDINAYLDDARAHGLAIERVIETHFHADFLSGHLELAEATGAAISFGSQAEAEFPIERLAARPAPRAGRRDPRGPAHAWPHAGVDVASSSGSTPTTPSRGAC